MKQQHYYDMCPIVKPHTNKMKLGEHVKPNEENPTGQVKVIQNLPVTQNESRIVSVW